jgi:tetratricopeptide (TPR) repeat protein
MKYTMILTFIWFAVFSCSSSKVDEKTLKLYAEAAGAYREARYGDVISLLSRPGNFPPALVLKGKAEYFAGRAGDAEKTLRRARSLSRGGTESVLFLARALMDQGRFEEARSLAETILAGDPLDLRALRLAALLARESGPSGEAAGNAFLDRAAEASLEAALVFLDRAKLRWIGGRGAEALADLEKARILAAENLPLASSIETLEKAIKEKQ